MTSWCNVYTMMPLVPLFPPTPTHIYTTSYTLIYTYFIHFHPILFALFTDLLYIMILKDTFLLAQKEKRDDDDELYIYIKIKSGEGGRESSVTNYV